MDNLKTDNYYIQKIQNDLKFIVEHMWNVDIEELNANEILLDSMLFRMIQLSENARKLSDEYKILHGSSHAVFFEVSWADHNSNPKQI